MNSAFGSSPQIDRTRREQGLTTHSPLAPARPLNVIEVERYGFDVEPERQVFVREFDRAGSFRK